MIALGSQSGNALQVGTGTISRISAAPAGHSVKFGNGATYSKPNLQVYAGMWGIYQPNNDNFVYSCDVAYNASTFPTGTMIEWSTVPDPRYGGVLGYLALSYGNYDSNAQPTITPKQIKNITTLIVNVNWTLTNDTTSGLLSETYLTGTPKPTGGVSGEVDNVGEIAFFPHNTTNTINYAQGGSVVGTGFFNDINGVRWNVTRQTSGVGTNLPYIIACRVGYVDHQGPLDYKSYFNFLVTSGLFTGNEYFDGVAFGVEPFGKTTNASLSFDSYSVTYV